MNMRQVLCGAGLACALCGGPGPWGAALAQVTQVRLFKAAWYIQDSEEDPALLPQAEEPFDFAATARLSDELLADPDALLFISGMTLCTPAGRTEVMDFAPGSGGFLFYEGAVTAQALNLRFGPGDYRLTLRSLITGDTAYTVPLAPDDYPPAPKILNFAAAQAIDPGADFTLRWAEFTGGGIRRITLEIADGENFEVVFAPPPLEGEATTVVIPAGTLQPNHAYVVTLLFTRLTHAVLEAVPQIVSGFEAHSHAPLRTTGGSRPPPRFARWRLLTGGELELRVLSPAGGRITLESAAGPVGSWQTLEAVDPVNGEAVFIVPRAVLGERRFFRARED